MFGSKQTSSTQPVPNMHAKPTEECENVRETLRCTTAQGSYSRWRSANILTRQDRIVLPTEPLHGRHAALTYNNAQFPY